MVEININRTLLTSLGIGLGFDINIQSNNSEVREQEMINLKALENFLLNGEE